MISTHFATKPPFTPQPERSSPKLWADYRKEGKSKEGKRKENKSSLIFTNQEGEEWVK